ncbi:DUF4381 domain-containing protein [Bosea sp. LjRoot9]|uniref:DUF4381 domain-containing protein n=1 Tax=Bosea sp. LjRoot9 TaxID=3342341 RepID=UPI003ECD6364
MSADPGDLANLADLALPPPAPFWPPAIGIWIVAVAALAALTVFAWRALRRYRADAYLREALSELDALAAVQRPDQQEAIEAVSSIMKRVALVRYGREPVASLTGAAWTAFIARTAPRDAQTDAIADCLATSPMPGNTSAPSDRHFFAQAKAWLRGQRGRTAAEA